MRKIFCLLLALCLLLSGCAAVAEPETKQYTATFLDLFDTVTTILGPGASEEAFRAEAQKIHDDLLAYHRLFDIYEAYEGIVNLKVVNDMAGKGPVEVEEPIIRLLTDCKAYHELTGGRVDVTMGAVLRLWHEARSDGIRDPMDAELPDMEELEAAAEHRGFDRVEIDPMASTVEITDPAVSFDVGARHPGSGGQQSEPPHHLRHRRFGGHQR